MLVIGMLKSYECLYDVMLTSNKNSLIKKLANWPSPVTRHFNL